MNEFSKTEIYALILKLSNTRSSLKYIGKLEEKEYHSADDVNATVTIHSWFLIQ